MSYRKIVRYYATAAKATVIDANNRFNYGAGAPRFAERIFVDVSPDIESLGLGKQLFGKVFEEWPPLGRRLGSSIMTTEPFISCAQHWIDGAPWEQTRAYQRMAGAIRRKGVADRCRSMDDVFTRYEALDRLFEKAKKDREISCHSDYDPWAFRELGGIVFHIGPGGKPFFGRVGQHRLAIALVLGIRSVPAALGGTHVDALPLLRAFRSKPRDQ